VAMEDRNRKKKRSKLISVILNLKEKS